MAACSGSHPSKPCTRSSVWYVAASSVLQGCRLRLMYWLPSMISHVLTCLTVASWTDICSPAFSRTTEPTIGAQPSGVRNGRDARPGSASRAACTSAAKGAAVAGCSWSLHSGRGPHASIRRFTASSGALSGSSWNAVFPSASRAIANAGDTASRRFRSSTDRAAAAATWSGVRPSAPVASGAASAKTTAISSDAPRARAACNGSHPSKPCTRSPGLKLSHVQGNSMPSLSLVTLMLNLSSAYGLKGATVASSPALKVGSPYWLPPCPGRSRTGSPTSGVHPAGVMNGCAAVPGSASKLARISEAEMEVCLPLPFAASPRSVQRAAICAPAGATAPSVSTATVVSGTYGVRAQP
mmetsp:Transcript_16795/g.46246  ORF Transcript_16795/g.46246 Transcript_16795/m.46246 type:complete len:354 (+) Transcript_16795:1008-2069(+)